MGALLRACQTAHSNIFSVEKQGFRFQALQIIGVEKFMVVSGVCVVGRSSPEVVAREIVKETVPSILTGLEAGPVGIAELLKVF